MCLPEPHRSDREEFYQLLTYTDDVDPSQKLAAWEKSCNLSRPHAAVGGSIPYETVKSLLESTAICAGGSDVSQGQYVMFAGPARH